MISPVNRTRKSARTLDRCRERCARKYRLAKKQALVYFRNQKLEESLLFAQASSTFARSHHFGVWYDDELEELLSSVGVSMFHNLANHPPWRGVGCCRMLYVATDLDALGGHSEVLRLWLKLFSGKQNVEQYVITTSRATPAFLAEIEGTGCVSLSIGGDTLTEKIESFIQQCLEVKPGYIFLFADPDDVVAIVAVNVLKARLGARVIFYDHAESVFWLGKNVTDVLVEFSPSQAYVSRKFRKYARCLAVIPLTTDLTDGSVPKCEPEEARESTSSLSIASPWKIVSDGSWNYFGVIRKILERNPTHTHVLLTLPDKHITEALRNWPKSLLGRLILAYNVASLASYYRQADFLIETFPFVGGQVRIEAMAFGLPVIFVRNSRLSHIFAHSGIDAIVGSYPFIADSNDDVTNHAEVLIRNLDLRRRCGHFLKAIFRRDFPPEVVRAKLAFLVEDASPSDCFDSFSEMAGKVHVDDNYLLSGDLARAPVPSPFLLVGRHMLRNGRFRFRVLFDCLRNLMIEDWLWSWKRLARRMRVRVKCEIIQGIGH